MVNVVSRYVPFVNGLEAVVISGCLLARGAGREIGISIDSLLLANPIRYLQMILQSLDIPFQNPLPLEFTFQFPSNPIPS